MSTIRTVFQSIIGIKAIRRQSTGRKMRRTVQCESLEGRQLLNRGWGFASGAGMRDGLTGAGVKLDPAQMASWNGLKSLEKRHGPGIGPGFAAGGFGRDSFAVSPQVKADVQTLRSDIKTLQAEIPTALQAQLKADKATVEQALASLDPSQRKAERLTPPSTTPSSDPTAFLTTQLQAANVSASQIAQITTDLQNYQTTIQSVDPTLYAKITTDQAALAQDLPPGHHASQQLNPGFLLGPQL
jgi:hypothetical protein